MILGVKVLWCKRCLVLQGVKGVVKGVWCQGLVGVQDLWSDSFGEETVWSECIVYKYKKGFSFQSLMPYALCLIVLQALGPW